jgi:hypothetical protein
MALSIVIRSASNIFHNHNVEDRFNRVHQRDFGISRPLIVWQVLVGHLNPLRSLGFFQCFARQRKKRLASLLKSRSVSLTIRQTLGARHL